MIQHTLQLRFVALPLLLKDVYLDGKIRIRGRFTFQLVENGEELEADELVTDPEPILELRR